MNALTASGLNLDIWPEETPPSPQALLQHIAGAEGLITMLSDRIDARVLEAAGPQLRVISQMAVGVDNIDLDACTARGIPVGHTPGVLSDAVADLTIGLMLATTRRLIEAAEDVKAGRWQSWSPMGWVGPSLYDSTVGLVGMGRIGLAVARRLTGFGVRILYHNRHVHPQAAQVGATLVDLDTLLAESDFVSLHCPYTPETHHLIDAAALARMKPSATLINTARGGVVDQDALMDALRSGQIRAAGLDVTTPEPLPATHPLLSLPNVVVLPHIGSAGQRARSKMAEMTVQNLLAGLAGEPLPWCANPQVYAASQD